MGKVFKGYSELGGYPTIVIKDSYILCSSCANKLDEEEKEGFEEHVIWEGSSNYCEECSVELETAYGDPEDSED